MSSISHNFIFIMSLLVTISTTVSHISNYFTPITVTVIYAPATRQDRLVFFRDLTTNLHPFFQLDPTNHIVLGDWNYSYAISPVQLSGRTPYEWLQFVSKSFVDCLTSPGDTHANTFHRGTGSSCLDYIFVSTDLAPFKASSSKFNLPLKDSVPQTGPGLWRAHPSLTRDGSFCTLLVSNIESLFCQFSSEMTAQCKWERIKEKTKDTALRYSRRKAFNLQRGERLLQKKHSVILTQMVFNHLPSSDLLPQLRIVENQLSSIQQYHTDTLALRASIRWREKGENSAGYLKRTVQHNARRKNIPCLRYLVTSALCHTKDDML
ncbi:unnamed protein product [Rhizopus stolonifer]